MTKEKLEMLKNSPLLQSLTTGSVKTSWIFRKMARRVQTNRETAVLECPAFLAS